MFAGPWRYTPLPLGRYKILFYYFLYILVLVGSLVGTRVARGQKFLLSNSGQFFRCAPRARDSQHHPHYEWGSLGLLGNPFLVEAVASWRQPFLLLLGGMATTCLVIKSEDLMTKGGTLVPPLGLLARGKLDLPHALKLVPSWAQVRAMLDRGEKVSPLICFLSLSRFSPDLCDRSRGDPRSCS